MTSEPSRARNVPTNRSGRFVHIDALRAVAVMLVVVAHGGLGHIVPGGSGVTIFFAISGFIITYLLLRERDRTGGFSARAFYRRRLYKIAPPLVVAVVVPTLVWAAWRDISWGAFTTQVLFVFNWAYLGHPDVLPGSGVVWSLAIEEQFYIALALLWPWVIRGGDWQARLRLVAWSAIIYATTARFVLALLDGDHDRRIYYGTDTRIDGIAWGVLAALLLVGAQRGEGRAQRVLGRVTTDGALVAAVLLYLASLVVRDDFFRETARYSMQSLAACVMILYGFRARRTPLQALVLRVAAARSVQAIGLASYSIYLVHLTVQTYVRHALPDLPEALHVTLGVAAGTLVGLVLYRLVEVPVERFRNRARSQPGYDAAPPDGADPVVLASTGPTPTSRR